jgi:outer membrane protein assembly factor BamB
MKFSRSKTTATIVSLFLMFAIAVSLVALPTANAQDFTIYISSPTAAIVNYEFTIRLEVRPAGSTSRIRHEWYGAMLAVMYPGRTSWTHIGPYNVDSGGRLTQPFTCNETGTFQFMWIVPPQQELPPNPDDPDGLWYSQVATTGVYTEETFPGGHSPPWEIPTFAHIYVTINPIGVGQATFVYMFLTPTYPDEDLTNNYRFHNYKLIITKPDDKTETITFEYVSDPTSSQGYLYTPDQTGEYTLKFEFPGQVVRDYPHRLDSEYVNDVFLASSASTTLTVQEEQIPPAITSYPLPKEYWTRPIYGENTDWWAISSNWLGSGAPGYGSSVSPNEMVFPGDAVGSQTSHVMWTKSNQPGGVVGGNNFPIQGNTYFEGTAYQQRFTNPIIVYGRIYYTEPLSFQGGGRGGTVGPTVCVDLRTGELIWSRTDVPPLDFAYIMDLETPNYHGVYPAILCTSNFGQCFDAATGEPLFNVTGVPSGTAVLGPIGEHLRYAFVNNGTRSHPDYYLCEWNSSLMWGGGATPSILTTTTTTSRLVNKTYWENDVLITHSESVSTTTTEVHASSGVFYDYLDSVSQNKSIAWRNTMTQSPSILGAFYNDILLCRNGSYPSLAAQNPYTYFAVDINRTHGTFGQVLWYSNVNPPQGGNITIISYAGADPTAGYFCESYRQTQQFVGYSLKNGKQLWVGDPQPALDYYGSTGPGTLSNVIAYGHIYSGAYGGVLYCYDMATGDVLWTYGNGGPGNSTDSGFACYYGHYPIFVNAIGNGIVYTVTTEHTYETPIYKGSLTRAINATDGTEIYTLSAATGEFGAESFAIADGFTVFYNSYSQQIYCIGKGPSATTVSIQNDVTTHGNKVLVKGSVIDVSAGTKQEEQAARFPNGLPAVSDANMSAWMEYVYQQKPRPTDVTGVEVIVSVLDPNSNFYEVGRATSDANGMFSCVFTPEVPGQYTVIASFDGSEGYWRSSAATALFVEEEPAATPEPTPPPASAADLYFMPVSIGMIVAIMVVLALLVLLLRRR